MDRPLASVVIPAWNAAGTIGAAIASVLSSELPDLECIVVDDGSTDATASVVAQLAAGDPRVILRTAPTNGGPSAARNLGVAAARGEWLAFLDSDDVLLPGGLDALVRAASDGTTRAVIGQRVWSDGRRRWITAAYDHPDIRTPGRASIASRPGLLFYASATGKLFHRSLVDGLAFEGRVLGDQPWTIRALLRAGDRIAVIGDVVYEWRRDQAAGSSSITAAKHGSAGLAAEAARVAIGALAEVAAEASVQLPEPEAGRVTAAYFDRLVRSDLAGPVRRAVGRGDPGTAALLGAIQAFLVSAPPEIVGASPALGAAIVRPPLDRWPWLRAPARRAYRSMLRSLATAHPASVARWARPGPLRAALRLLLRSESPASAIAVSGLLALRLPAVVVARLRRGGGDGRRFVSPRGT